MTYLQKMHHDAMNDALYLAGYERWKALRGFLDFRSHPITGQRPRLFAHDAERLAACEGYKAKARFWLKRAKELREETTP